jgi:hypothetical protein
LDNNNKKTEEIDFHQAAILNENGEEVAITEEMVQKACAELDSSSSSEKTEASGSS